MIKMTSFIDLFSPKMERRPEPIYCMLQKDIIVDNIYILASYSDDQQRTLLTQILIMTNQARRFNVKTC